MHIFGLKRIERNEKVGKTDIGVPPEVFESMEQRISLRLNEEEVRVLENIAVKNGLVKSDNVPSISKALKYLIRHFNENQQFNARDHTAHMINLLEQINIMIPHLVLQTNFASRVQSERLSENDYKALLVKSLQATARLCGQIQACVVLFCRRSKDIGADDAAASSKQEGDGCYCMGYGR